METLFTKTMLVIAWVGAFLSVINSSTIAVTLSCIASALVIINQAYIFLNRKSKK
jgi:hypothetical protein